jgi:hypothetical protein
VIIQREYRYRSDSTDQFDQPAYRFCCVHFGRADLIDMHVGTSAQRGLRAAAGEGGDLEASIT